MSAEPILNPFPAFVGSDGRPLSGGYVYVGEANKDPRAYPVDVFYDQDMAVPATQPMRTNLGYVVRNGAPTPLWVDGDYSLLVLDSLQRQVFYVASRTMLSAANINFQLTYAGAALQDLETVLAEGYISVTQFMLPGHIADLALTTPLLDQSANIQAAVDSGARAIHFPKGNYKVSGTIRLKDGAQLIGAGSLQGLGTSIRFSKNDGTHCFDSDPALFLSAVTVEGMEVVNTANAAGTVGVGDAFHLFAVTNNCKFRDVLVRNFGGDAWDIGKQTTNPADKTACANVVFDQCFAVSCGGYAFDINGYTNALWLMPDVNSCATGYWRFQDGTTNQTMINVVSPWVEGTQTWAALTVFEMVDTKGQMLNVIGGNITNSRAGTSRVVKSTTTSCRLNFQGTGFGFTYLHEDTPSSYNTTLNAPTVDFYNVASRQFQAMGSAPINELILLTGGTVDQRRFRASISSNNWLLSARDDAGSSVRNLLFINHANGAMLAGADNSYTLGGASNRWSVVYAGNGTINTSDAREKQQVRPLSDAERAVALRLKGLVRAFKFNDAVLAKGDGARIHVGVIAQDVKEAFEAEGLVAEHYGLLCFDEWEAEPELLDADGNVEVSAKAAGNRYGVRYEQLLAFVVSAL